MAAAELIGTAFGGGQVDFLLAEDLPIGREVVSGVEDLTALEDGVGSSDDVDNQACSQSPVTTRAMSSPPAHARPTAAAIRTGHRVTQGVAIAVRGLWRAARSAENHLRVGTFHTSPRRATRKVPAGWRTMRSPGTTPGPHIPGPGGVHWGRRSNLPVLLQRCAKVICGMSIVVIACFTEWATIAFARSNML